MTVLIDGYNLMHALSILSGGISLEEGRRQLLDTLGMYKRKKGHKMVVVFDGKDKVSMGEERMRCSGIEVVFTRRGETADEVLVKMAARLREGAVVITSDRSIRDEVLSFGTQSFTSQDFGDKLWWFQYSEMKGGEEPEEYYPPGRKLSKKERIRRRVWNKL